MLARLGGWCFSHGGVVIAGWVGFLALIIGITQAAGTDFAGGPEIPDSDSATGFDLLAEEFEGLGGFARGTLVFRADEGVDDADVRAAMEEIFADIDALGDELRVVSPYGPAGMFQVASEGDFAGRIAFAELLFESTVNERESGRFGERINELLDESGIRDLGVQVEVGGEFLTVFEPPESEALGLAFAVIILTVALGSVIAMGMTTGVALVAVGAGVILFGLSTHLLSAPEFATTIGVMIGLGVGIDYALFIVTRHREALDAGHEPQQAIEVAIDTAGRAVLFAGVTVVVSLLGMLLMGLEFISGMGLGAAAVVSSVMVASITLLPAVLGLAGPRLFAIRNKGVTAALLVAVGLAAIGLGITPLAVLVPLGILVAIVGRWLPWLRDTRPPRRRNPPSETIWYRMSHRIQDIPWPVAIATTLVLVILSLPVFGLRLGFSDEGNYPEDTTTRRAYDLLTDGFGAGSNGPLLVVVRIDGAADLPAVEALSGALGDVDGVASVTPPLPNDFTAPTAAVLQLIPTTAPQDQATEQLVHRLRDDVIPAAVGESGIDVFVTGSVAAGVDFTDFLGRRLILFLGVVLLLSFLLLMAVFRSLLVPLKAVIMNILSISAAYGITIAVFQWGWGATLFGTTGGPIEPFVPMMLFAIVFGLSMDYEVFLLSRIKEEYERTGDARESVASGLTLTAGVITAAASIMVVVFGSFLLEDLRVIKLFGLGLSLAILLDATLVRMLLVPSTMQLLGDRNWWLPGWLDRLLPRLNVEGTGVHELPMSEAEIAHVLEETGGDVTTLTPRSMPLTERPELLDDIAGLGPSKRAALVDAFSTVGALVDAEPEALMAVPGFGPVLADRVLTEVRDRNNGG